MKTPTNHCASWDDAAGPSVLGPQRPAPGGRMSRSVRFFNGSGRLWFGSSVLLFGFLTAACDADFVDLRDEAAQGLNPVESPDAGFIDVGPTQGDDDVLKVGDWTGRSDYSASGQASVVRLANGQLELRFSDDFRVDRVPGPVVLLSTRETLGRRLDPGAGDVELGRLQTERGAQTYQLPADVEDRTFAWVYCLPFGLEVARVSLEDL